MAVFRYSLLSGRRSLSSFSNLLSSSSRVTPNTNPTSLTSPLISTPAISIHPPHNTLILSHPYTSPSDPPQPINRNPKLVNFSLSDSDSDSETLIKPETNVTDKPKLPPPYDPFKKQPPFEDPEDPKNLQEVFHEMRSEGLMSGAVKMFDGLSKLGLTHEALELFRIIKDKGTMPEVVAHTAVIEAYAAASQPKAAHKVFLRMLAAGVAPNAYTYTVLIRGLAGGDKRMVKEAKRYLVEMMEKGMKPSVEAYTAVAEALVVGGKEAEAREMVEVMRGKGFEFDEEGVREALKGKRGPARNVISVLFGK